MFCLPRVVLIMVIVVWRVMSAETRASAYVFLCLVSPQGGYLLGIVERAQWAVPAHVITAPVAGQAVGWMQTLVAAAISWLLENIGEP